MRTIVDRKGLDRLAASTSQMGRFETEWLATEGCLTKHNMFYVYLIQSEAFPEQRYIGFTADRRFRAYVQIQTLEIDLLSRLL